MDPALPSPVKPFPIPSPTPPPLSPSQDLPSYSTTDLEHYRLSFDSGLADDFRNDQRNPESQEVDSVRGGILSLLQSSANGVRGPCWRRNKHERELKSHHLTHIKIITMPH